MPWLPMLLGLAGPASPAGAAAAPAPVIGRPDAVLVLDPAGESLGGDERRVFASAIGASLGRRLAGVAEVLTVVEVREIMNADADRQGLGCDDAGCATDLAGALGTAHVVVSHVVRLGDRFTLSIELLDMSSARVLARGEVAGESLAALTDRIDVATGPVVDALRPPSPWTVLWPVGMLGGAALVATGGIAWDVLAPSSRNARFDAEDVIGPVAVVASVGLVAAAFFNPLERP